MSRTKEENRKPEEAEASSRPGKALSAEEKRRVIEELYRTLTS